MNPKISIIIPTYNNLKNLRLCVDSIKKQTFLNYEVWIIDGASTDKTTEFLQTLKAPFFWKSEKDTGIYNAMNKGILFAKGDWLYFLGADDVLAEATILQRIFEEEIKENISLLSGKIAYKEDDNLYEHAKKECIKTPSWNFSIWIRNGLHHQATFYKKTLFSKNLYDESYQFLADYAFNLQLYKEDKACLLIDEMIAICSLEGISYQNNWKMYLEEKKLKTALSSRFLSPLFLLLIFIKHFIKK